MLLQRRTEEAHAFPPFVEGMASRWMVDASYDNRHFCLLWLGLLLVVLNEGPHGPPPHTLARRTEWAESVTMLLLTQATQALLPLWFELYEQALTGGLGAVAFIHLEVATTMIATMLGTIPRSTAWYLVLEPYYGPPLHCLALRTTFFLGSEEPTTEMRRALHSHGCSVRQSGLTNGCKERGVQPAGIWHHPIHTSCTAPPWICNAPKVTCHPPTNAQRT